MAKEAAQIIVSGVVQGVGYRAWTERTARDLALDGWVRNLEDGRVEIFVQGESTRIRELVERARRGPRHADVSAIDVRKREPIDVDGFSVKRDAGAEEP